MGHLMDQETQAALADLLTVTALSQVTPLRLQAWQTAARGVLADASPVTDAPVLVWPTPSAKDGAHE